MIKLDTIIVNDTIPIHIVKQSVTTLEYLSDPGTIIAIIAIIVSVFGLIFSVWYNRQSIKLSIEHNNQSIKINRETLEKTIEHNKLSVKPYITHKQANKDLSYTYDLLNNGLGPAILNSVYFYYNRKRYQTISEIYEAHRPDIYKLIDRRYSDATVYGPDTPIQGNGKINCLTIKFKEKVKDRTIFLKKINIIVEYSDIYGKHYKYDTKLR